MDFLEYKVYRESQLAHSSGPWMNHKYVRKEVNKEGKTVYIYSDTNELGGVNIMTFPYGSGKANMAKRDENARKFLDKYGNEPVNSLKYYDPEEKVDWFSNKERQLEEYTRHYK